LENEIVLVDDAPPTAPATSSGKLQQVGGVKSFRIASTAGKGAALRTALEHATGDIILISGCRPRIRSVGLSKPAATDPRSRADVVYGSRFTGGTHRVLLFWHLHGQPPPHAAVEHALQSQPHRHGKPATRSSAVNASRDEAYVRRFGIEPELTAKLARRRYPSTKPASIMPAAITPKARKSTGKTASPPSGSFPLPVFRLTTAGALAARLRPTYAQILVVGQRPSPALRRFFSTSPVALLAPNENRTAARVNSCDSPIALSTCDGSREPTAHADPLETATPSRSSPSNSPSSSQPSKLKLIVLPDAQVRVTVAMRSGNPSRDLLAKSLGQPEQPALLVPHLRGRQFGAPSPTNDRRHVLRARAPGRSRGCANSNGAIFVPRRAYSTPMPFGP